MAYYNACLVDRTRRDQSSQYVADGNYYMPLTTPNKTLFPLLQKEGKWPWQGWGHTSCCGIQACGRRGHHHVLLVTVVTTAVGWCGITSLRLGKRRKAVVDPNNHQRWMLLLYSRQHEQGVVVVVGPTTTQVLCLFFFFLGIIMGNFSVCIPLSPPRSSTKIHP